MRECKVTSGFGPNNQKDKTGTEMRGPGAGAGLEVDVEERPGIPFGTRY